jgi:hypothetical protein
MALAEHSAGAEELVEGQPGQFPRRMDGGRRCGLGLGGLGH